MGDKEQSNTNYTITVNNQKLSDVMITEGEAGLWSATCLYWEDTNRRLLKVSGEEGQNKLFHENIAGTSLEELLGKLDLWAREKFEQEDVNIKKV